LVRPRKLVILAAAAAAAAAVLRHSCRATQGHWVPGGILIPDAVVYYDSLNRLLLGPRVAHWRRRYRLGCSVVAELTRGQAIGATAGTARDERGREARARWQPCRWPRPVSMEISHSPWSVTSWCAIEGS
jgi:hypothetical protein